MPEIVKEALVPHSKEAMFDLVLDIQSYPLFLPWCPKVEIHAQEVSTEEPNTTFTDATLFVQKGFMSFSFRTKNLNKKAEFIQMNLIEGPFKELHGTWEFSSLGETTLDEKKIEGKQNACKIKFSLSYVFANRALDMTLNPMMQKLADSFLDAFCQRANNLQE